VEEEEPEFSWAITILEKSMLRSHPLLIRPWSVIIPSKSSESSKEANPRSMGAFAKILLVAIASLGCWYPKLFSFFSPSRSILQTVEPHPFSATTVRRRDAALPFSSAVTITSPRPRGLTIVEPRVANTGYPSWFGWPLQPHCGHKREDLCPVPSIPSSASVQVRHHRRSCPSSS
jgi:hypothetical protein